ncbi:MAG: hypothetical protein IIT46_07110 [Lachnospiraceae bacterium]|nr:hypothetical protein [Lachnospiraceae bacterium]
MVEQWMELHVMRMGMIVAGVIGMSIELVLSLWSSRLLRKQNRDEIDQTALGQLLKSRLLLGKKYGVIVNNVDRFVDKCVNKQKILGINLCTWQKRCGQLKILSFVFAIFSIVGNVYINCGQVRLMRECIYAVIMSTLWISVHSAGNYCGKLEYIRDGSLEFVENQLLPLLIYDNPEIQIGEYLTEIKGERGVKKSKDAHRNNPKRAEIEKVKKELVEELKQERKKRDLFHLDTCQMQKNEPVQDMDIEKDIMKKMNNEEMKLEEKEENMGQDEQAETKKERFKTEGKQKDREPKASHWLGSQILEQENDSQLLKEILREYLQ